MTATKPIALDDKEKRLVHTMQLLGDSTRFKIFKLLLGGKDLCVSEIASQLDISVSAVSQHFRSFELIGLVNKERTGQKICYELRKDDEFVEHIVNITKEK